MKTSSAKLKIVFFLAILVILITIPLFISATNPQSQGIKTIRTESTEEIRTPSGGVINAHFINQYPIESNGKYYTLDEYSNMSKVDGKKLVLETRDFQLNITPYFRYDGNNYLYNELPDSVEKTLNLVESERKYEFDSKLTLLKNLSKMDTFRMFLLVDTNYPLTKKTKYLTIKTLKANFGTLDKACYVSIFEQNQTIEGATYENRTQYDCTFDITKVNNYRALVEINTDFDLMKNKDFFWFDPEVGVIDLVPGNRKNTTNYGSDNTIQLDLSDNNLIGYWDFNVNETVTTFDYSDNNIDGTLNGNPIWNATGGIDGLGSYFFDGIGAYIDISGFYIGGDAIESDNFTYTAWINTAGVNGVIVEERVGAQDTSMYLENSELRFGAWQGSPPTYASGGSISKGVWTHVAGVYNGTKATIYIDGAFVNTTQLSDVPGHITIPTFKYQSIARMDDGNSWSGGLDYFFNGSIDEVMIFNRSIK